MRTRTVAVAVVSVVVAVVTAVAVGAAVTDGPRRPPLSLPAASAFPEGTCRDAADAVLALGRFTYDHTGASRLPAGSYPFLKQRAEQLAALREGAEEALSGRIDAVLTAIGFLRLQPGKAYDPRLLRDLEAARTDLQQTCVSQA
jgi:hypothetical protein